MVRQTTQTENSPDPSWGFVDFRFVYYYHLQCARVADVGTHRVLQILKFEYKHVDLD